MKKYVQKVEALFKRNEFKELPSPSAKYRKFKAPSGTIYWLGRHGAVRKGQTSSTSRSVSHMIKKMILKKEENQNEKSSG